MAVFIAGAPNPSSVTATGSTTAREIADRFAEIINVKDFGAVGNSDENATTGTNDTPAIQAAVAALEARGGGIIFFPRGAYKVEASIVFASVNVQYIFEGVGNASAHAGVVDGSCLVGNFAGFILDRNAVNYANSRVIIRNLGVRNIGGGAIRVIGHDTSQITGCNIKASTFGIKMGQIGIPLGSTFTGTSSGTTLTVSGIGSNPLLASTFPLPIADGEVGIIGAVTIEEQLTPPGSPGGNGTYRTNIATTCVGNPCTSHPNAPTSMSSVVSNCLMNGTGTFNTNPAASFVGVGVQLATNTIIRDCHITNFGTAIRAGGAQCEISSCQLESNTNGIVLGVDGEGAGHTTTCCSIISCSLESNYIGIWTKLANQVTIQSCFIQLNVDASHNSLYGIVHDCGTDLKIVATSIGGTVDTGGYGFYLRGAVGDMHRVRVECSALLSVGKEATKNYSILTAVQSYTGIVHSCTLAQLAAEITAGYISPGEVRLIHDANVALGSQVYGATVTGGSNKLARVWHNGANIVYG